MARSQPGESSSEERDANDVDIGVGAGRLNFTAFERHLGIGIVNCEQFVNSSTG